MYTNVPVETVPLVSTTHNKVVALNNQLDLCYQILKIIIGVLGLIFMLSLIFGLFSLIPTMWKMRRGYNKTVKGIRHARIAGHEQAALARVKYDKLKGQAKSTLADAHSVLGTAAYDSQGLLHNKKYQWAGQLQQARNNGKVKLNQATVQALPQLSGLASRHRPRVPLQGITTEYMASQNPLNALKDGTAGLLGNMGINVAQAINLKTANASADAPLKALKAQARGAINGATQGIFAGLQAANFKNQNVAPGFSRYKNEILGALAGAAQGASSGALSGPLAQPIAVTHVNPVPLIRA